MPKNTLVSQFPDDFFPPSFEQFRQSVAESLSIDPEYVAGPMLAAAGTAIGTAATAVLKPGWEEPASVFVSVVGYKSSGKTPACKNAFKPLRERQQEREQSAAELVGEDVSGPKRTLAYSVDTDLDGDLAEDLDPSMDGGDGIAGGALFHRAPNRESIDPPAPVAQLVVNDTTLPALWDVLEYSQRGVAVVADELSPLFLRSSAADRQTWCEVYQADPRRVHRKTRRKGPVVLGRTFVSLVGGIQPDLFSVIRGKFDGGLLERFLICGKPETRLPPMTDEIVDPDFEAAWNLGIVALLDIERAEYAGPEAQRGYVQFTREAYGRLQKLYADLEEYLVFMGVDVKHHGIVRKLVANAGRLALIRRCLRWAIGEFGFYGPVGKVELDDCDAACRAAEFFLSRYLMWVPGVLPRAAAGGSLAAGPVPAEPDLTDRILIYLESRNMSEVEVRWLQQQTLKGRPSTAALRAALDEAVARGLGHWADKQKKTFIRG